MNSFLSPSWLRRLAIGLLLVSAALWLRGQKPAANGAFGLALAKGQYVDRLALPISFATELDARDAALADPAVAALLGDHDVDFLYAHPLTAAEAAAWRDAGCATYQCRLATFYDYDHQRSVAALVDGASGRVLDARVDAVARPAASLRQVPRLLAIAAADSRVRDILGDVRTAQSVMVPMSTWLVDDACRDDWCVDLTFPDPAGSGEIVHVVVNLRRESVARLFYTRGRAARSGVAGEAPAGQTRPGKPIAQAGGADSAFANGCHEQYGWAVCWEMTAHDGLAFQEATFDDRLVFTSAKISQVEVYYAAWPGGYRDELGFAASVPAAQGTRLTDLGDGFEVRQLFTEPFDWPNCVCCYRYEEVLTFLASGGLEMRVVSHGPGCDELSSYRPFWRVDLDLDGPSGDEVWHWQGDQWVEAVEELDLNLFDELGPGGQRLATFDGELHYRWAPQPTDPLGVDEGRLFILRWQEDEGVGPIEPGPADTFRPPRQWVDGQRVSGNNAVIWYVPILKTKKAEPWWCVPDPAPNFSPCEAILRLEPAGALGDDAPVAATPVTAGAATRAPAATAVAGGTPAPTRPPAAIAGVTGSELLLNAGCLSCHVVGELGQANKVGPDLSNIGDEAADRVAGQSAEEYIRESIVAPNSFLAPDCPNGECLANIMPGNYAARLNAGQIDTLVVYLLAQSDGAAPASGGAAPIGATATEPPTLEPTQPAPATTRNGPFNNPLPWLAIAGTLLVLLGVGTSIRNRRKGGESG